MPQHARHLIQYTVHSTVNTINNTGTGRYQVMDIVVVVTCQKN
jgi:hypothetical protein